MGLSYTARGATRLNQGQKAPIPQPIVAQGRRDLPMDTNSDAIIGPCELRIVPGEAGWLDVKRVAAELDTGSETASELIAGVEFWVSCENKGNYFIKWTPA